MKNLQNLQNDHNEWIESLHDQIDHFLDWDGPILPHEAAGFQGDFAKLQGNLSCLCSNAGMLNEKLSNSGFTHEITKTNAEVQKIQEKRVFHFKN